MNFKYILNEIEQADGQLNDRRGMLKSFGSKVAIASLPLALGTLFQKASAKTTANDSIAQVLNFLLEMEYFAYNFYHTANNTGGLIPAAFQAGFLAVENQKKAHVLYLIGVVNAYGAEAYTPKNYDATAANPLYIVSGAYDFTSAGKYPEAVQVFTEFQSFVMMAEVFEDTFLHGYKGEIPAVVNDAAVLELMMRMQSAGGRHASFARYARRLIGYGQAPEHPAPWITNNIPPAASFQAFYNSEDAVGQQGVDISVLSGSAGQVPQMSATAAFDEAFEKSMVLALLAPFRK